MLNSHNSKKKLAKTIKDYDGENDTEVNEWGISIDLYQHQKTSVKKMEWMEKNRKRNYNDSSQDCIIESNFGILNDKVGSGKTLMCVSLISREVNSVGFCIKTKEKQFVEVIEKRGNSIFSITRNKLSTVIYLPISIIVVNNSVIYQWKDELDRSNLLYKLITKNNDIENLSKYLYNVNVIVITKTLYSNFVDEFNTLTGTGVSSHCVCRLIVDEYCRRGSFKEIKADYCWLISATIPTIFDFNRTEARINYINTCLLSSGEKSSWLMPYDWRYLIVKNNTEEMNLSFFISKINNVVYIAKGEYNNLLNMQLNVSQEIRRMIVADNIKGAIEAIGGNVEYDSLLSVIIRKEEEEIKKIEASITYYGALSQEDKKNEHIEKLVIIKHKLDNIKEKIERDEKDNECPLCCNEYCDKCLVNCCKNIICGKCTSKLMKINSKCPFCRSPLNLKDIIISSKTKNEIKKEIIKSKCDIIVDIITANPLGKFIIFSEYSNTYNVIHQVLQHTGLKYAEIKGTTEHKNKLLSKYKCGELNIIFLNGRFDGCGINLPQTTDIILYHKITSQTLETQLIGRALRLGRKSDLKVHRLLYQQECELEDDDNSINYLYDNVEENRANDIVNQIESDYELSLRLQNSS